MRAALLVLLYAVAVAWCARGLLTRLTARGARPQLGLAAWLTAMASVLAIAVVALQFLARAAIGDWSRLAETVCRSVAGTACTTAVYRSAAVDLVLGAVSAGAALAAAVLAWRYGRSVRQARQRTRAHAEAARIIGGQLPGAAAVVLDAPQPVAYCVAGRPATIVLTTGALAVLAPAQLSAVLAHERAHLAGHHHLLLALTRGLAVSFPAVPLFTTGAGEVARLVEMCADDAAVRHSDRDTLAGALLAMGQGTAASGQTACGRAACGQASPGIASLGAAAAGSARLAATARAVTDRVQRLLEPAGQARHVRNGLALISVTLLLAVGSGLVAAFAVPLAAFGSPTG